MIEPYNNNFMMSISSGTQSEASSHNSIQKFEQIMKSLGSDSTDRLAQYQKLAELLVTLESPIAAMLELCSELIKPFIKTDVNHLSTLIGFCVQKFSSTNLKVTIPNLRKLFRKMFPGKEIPNDRSLKKPTPFQLNWQNTQQIFAELKSKKRSEEQILAQIDMLFEDYEKSQLSDLEKYILYDRSKSLKTWADSKRRKIIVPKTVDFTPVLPKKLETSKNPVSLDKFLEPVEIKQIISNSDPESSSKPRLHSDKDSLEERNSPNVRNKSVGINPSKITVHQKPVQKTIPSSVSNIPLKKRTSFYSNEVLSIDENIETEYKEYALPLNHGQSKNILGTICSFLNKRGGRIYIGVSDDKVIKGIIMSENMRFSFSQSISEMSKCIFPELDSDAIKVQYLPIQQLESGKMIPSCFVVKIVVKQGNISKLYCLDDEKGLVSYIRRDGLKTKLNCDQIYQLIKRRADGNLEVEVDPKEFEDSVSDNF